MNLIRRDLIVFLLLALGISIVYFPALDVPFYLDDMNSLARNPVLQSGDLNLIYLNYGLRTLGYFSFLINYQWFDNDPYYYHLFNIVIHLFNAFLVYILALLLSIHTSLKQSHIKLFALITAFLWAMHPLNTQAVTYIVQRLALLSTMMFLLSFVFYLIARRTTTFGKRVVFGLLFLISVLIGAYTKQNYFTVVIMLGVYELFFCKGRIADHRWRLLAILFVLFSLAVPFISEQLATLDRFTRESLVISRVDYFATQLVVLFDYIVKFFLPVNLQLFSDVSLLNFNNSDVMLAFVGHVIIVIVAFYTYRKSPLVTLSVALFYITHSVESSFIPITDLAFEHRTYLPNVAIGLLVALAITQYIQMLEQKSGEQKTAALVKGSVMTMLLVLSGLTWTRNTQWLEPETFYQREAALAPTNARANLAYGVELSKRGNLLEAEKYLSKSVQLDLSHNRITASGIVAYMSVLYQQKKYQQAAPVVMTALKHVTEPFQRSVLLSNLGYGYIQMGYCDFAIGLLKKAIAFNASNKAAHDNLNHCLKLKAKQQSNTQAR